MLYFLSFLFMNYILTMALDISQYVIILFSNSLFIHKGLLQLPIRAIHLAILVREKQFSQVDSFWSE